MYKLPTVVALSSEVVLTWNFYQWRSNSRTVRFPILFPTRMYSGEVGCLGIKSFCQKYLENVLLGELLGGGRISARADWRIFKDLAEDDLGKPSEEKICFRLEFCQMGLTPPLVFLDSFEELFLKPFFLFFLNSFCQVLVKNCFLKVYASSEVITTTF